MAEKIRWGILSTGTIATKFATGLQTVSDAELLAVGSRSEATADAFANKFKGTLGGGGPCQKGERNEDYDGGRENAVGANRGHCGSSGLMRHGWSSYWRNVTRVRPAGLTLLML